MKDFSIAAYGVYVSIRNAISFLFFSLCIGNDRQNTKNLYECAQAEKEVQDAFPLILSAIGLLFISNRISSSNAQASEKALAKSFIEKHKTVEALEHVSTEELSSFLKGAEHTDSLFGRISDFFNYTTWRYSHKYYQGRACENTNQFTTISDVKTELRKRL